METSPDPVKIIFPKNEITIVGFSLVISLLYNLQTGNGKWTSISLIIVLGVLLFGMLGVSSMTSLQGASRIMFSAFLILISAIMISFNFAFQKTLQEEIKDGYWTPVVIINVIYGIILLIGLIGTILISTNYVLMNETYMAYYNILFSLLITLVILNAGLMAGA